MKEQIKKDVKTNKLTTKVNTKRRSKPLLKVVEFAEKFSSTGSAFILATLGIITQTFHNGFLFFELSSFENFWLNLIQTTIGAFGLSGALLYFTIRGANGGSKVVQNLVWAFFAFEIYANLYYWSNKYIISVWGTDNVNYASMIIAVPFAIMIPFTIKAYAGELSFDGFFDEEENEDQLLTEQLEKTKESIKNEIIDDLSQTTNSNVNEIKEDLEDLKGRLNDTNNVEDLENIKRELKDIKESSENNIKKGEQFNLNIDTLDKDGNKTTKTLTSTIQK